MAEDARASAEVRALILVEHLGKSADGHNPARMYKAVEEARLDVERAAELVLDVIVLCRFVRRGRVNT